MSDIKDFEMLIKDTEIMIQVESSLKQEPLKLLTDICKKNEKSGLPVADYNLHIHGYIGEVSLKALTQAGLVEKVDGGKISLYSYQPTGSGLEYYRKLTK